MTDFKQWEGFEGRIWKEEVNTRDFIQKNYTPYDGDESFLAGPTDATNKLWGALQKLQKAERAKGGVLDMETEVVSGLTAYGPGYIDPELKDLEKVVGLQTDKPLKRAFMPYGGIKMAEQACTTYGYQPSEKLHEIFTKYTRTHNQAVFDAYTPEMKKDITPERLAQISALNDLARQRGQTLAEMALAWLLHHDEVTTVLIGASKTQQILDNIKAVEHTTFTPDELAVIDRISK